MVYTKKKAKYSPNFRIAQYLTAGAIGVLVAYVAPYHVELSPEAQVWPFPENAPFKNPSYFWWLPFDFSVDTQDSKPFQSKLHFISSKKPNYPWVCYSVESNEGSLSWRYTLTKEDFRCKGQGARAPIEIEENGIKNYLLDCYGNDHGLPYFAPKLPPVESVSPFPPASEAKERVQPALLEILNALSEKLNARVQVTSGHRCLKHHRYITKAAGSVHDKHLVAASADFFVFGYENTQAPILEALREICEERKNRLTIKNIGSLIEKGPSYFSSGEVELRYTPADQGRNLDNAHPYGYFTLSVLYDYEQAISVRVLPSEVRSILRN